MLRGCARRSTIGKAQSAYRRSAAEDTSSGRSAGTLLAIQRNVVQGPKVKFLRSKDLRFASKAALLFLVIVYASKVQAQAPPGPLPRTAPKDTPPSTSESKASPPNVARTRNLIGTWRLNGDDSDDPRKKLQQARDARNGSPGGGRRVGIGGGWPGGGRGGYGGRGTGGGESDSDREKMRLFLEPARLLTVSQKDPEVDVTDDRDRKFAFYTDNRKIEKSKDPNHQEFTAKWDEWRLVAEGKDPHGNKYERSYEVLEGNSQLRETLLLKIGRNNTEISIHYVYDLVPPAPSRPPAPQ